MLPTSFIVGIDVELSAEWAEGDRTILDIATRGDRFVSLGPFLLGSGRS
jgi:hypothetical protein